MAEETEKKRNTFATFKSLIDGVWGADSDYNKKMTREGNAAGATNTRNRSYDFSYRMFPADIENNYHGHYMVININVPTQIDDHNKIRGGYGNMFNLAGDGGDFYSFSTADRVRFAENGGTSGVDGAISRAALSTGRRTRRIKESIALAMPSGLVYNSQNRYEEISMTALMGRVGSGAVGLAVGAFGARNRSVDAALELARQARGTYDATGRMIGASSGVAGYPINPRVEVLFSHTDLRSFRFEILMAPRNEKESVNIKDIVRTLRFHGAPELDPQTAGFTFIPPAEFDISFYNKGVENTNIPRINSCVLNIVEVDYAPTNGMYSTFSNGHPVAVRLSLGFTEVEPLHKARINQGF